MKKLLLGSTALMAAGALAAAPAAAEEPISLNVGGYYQSVVSYTDQDVAGGTPEYHEVNVRQEGEVQFTGSTTLDNGLTIGVNIQLEAVAQGDQLDEQYVFFSGDWGRVNIGAENSAPYLMGYIAPGVGLGVNSPNFFLFSPQGSIRTTTVTTSVSDANKLTYFSPRFSGFQLGVSYTPNIDVRGGDRQTFGLNTDNDAGDQADFFGIGANFVEEFNGVDIAISGAYEIGDTEAASAGVDDDEAWQVGLNIGFSGFTVGGSYGSYNNASNGATATLDGDHDNWDIGASYSTGPWGVSLGYFHAEVEVLGGDDELDLGELGVSYALGPGVTIVGSLQYMDEDNTSAADSDGWAATVMSKLSF